MLSIVEQSGVPDWREKCKLLVETVESVWETKECITRENQISMLHFFVLAYDSLLESCPRNDQKQRKYLREKHDKYEREFADQKHQLKTQKNKKKNFI